MNDTFSIAAFALDGQRRELRDATGGLVALRPRAFDVLLFLARRAGALVTKDELLDAVWPGLVVTDDSLVQCIVEIRRALEPVAGINGLNFQLGARTLAITAPDNVVAQALVAIRRVGFDPQPLSAAAGSGTADGRSHAEAGDHDHKSASAGLWPLLLALALALSAEGVALLAGQRPGDRNAVGSNREANLLLEWRFVAGNVDSWRQRICGEQPITASRLGADNAM